MSVLSTAAAAAAVVALATPALAAPAYTHIAGVDRYETAALLSQQMPVPAIQDRGIGCSHVLLVNGSSFADAITGSAIAASDGGRVLLTGKDRIPEATWTEMRRMFGQTRCETVEVVGSIASVSRAVVDELQAYSEQQESAGKGDFSVIGGGGSDRYGTNWAVTSNVVRNSANPRPSTAFIATGENYPDALAAAQYTATIKGPLLLTPRNGIDEYTLDELKGRWGADGPYASIRTFYVVGGAGSVSDNVVAQLKALRPGVTVERIEGPDRYETATKLAQRFGTGRSTAVVATGSNFPDALAAAPFAARKDGVLLLSNGNTSTPAVRDQLARGGYRQTVTIGAVNASAVS